MDRVLIYGQSEHGSEYQALRILQRVLETNCSQETCTSLDTLLHRLRAPENTQAILVLAPADGDDLAKLIAIRNLMMDRRIILILPDTQEETISGGHRLAPRYLSYRDGDFMDVAAVIGKMLKNTQHAPYDTST